MPGSGAGAGGGIGTVATIPQGHAGLCQGGVSAQIPQEQPGTAAVGWTGEGSRSVPLLLPFLACVLGK